MRRRILDAFEQAERRPELAREYLTFVVVGAGPTGVELAGAMVEIAVHALAQEFDRIEASQARVVLVEGADAVLPPYPPDLQRSARRQLEELGVEVRLGAQVSGIEDAAVRLDDGTRIAARTVLWAAGVTASPLGAMLDAELDESGRVRVERDLSLPGHPEVFIVGDLARIEDDDGDTVPGLAPAAMQEGRHAAKQILAAIDGRPRAVFRYRDRGTLATIGRARAVANLPRIRFSGWLAWLAWLLIHVFYLIGFRNRVFVLLSWAWSYLTFRRGSRIITHIAPSPPRSDRDS
jgi:NADH dehydrogenase